MAQLRCFVLFALAAVADARLAVQHSKRSAVQASPSGLAGGAVPQSQPPMAMILPPDSLGEIIIVDGGVNFLSLYGGVLTLRILLSWFPQAQGVAFLRPIFTVSDVYLNLFRGVIPAVAGLDISPIAAFFVLNLLTSSVASLGSNDGKFTPRVPG